MMDAHEAAREYIAGFVERWPGVELREGWDETYTEILDPSGERLWHGKHQQIETGVALAIAEMEWREEQAESGEELSP